MNSKNQAPGNDDNEPIECASSPCSLAQVSAPSLGVLERGELLVLLNELLEAERAGARGLTELCLPQATPKTAPALRTIARDEGRYCVMLAAQIRRLDAQPSPATGAFYDKLAAASDLNARLELLDRGQGWVVRKLAAALPRIRDGALREALQEMLEVHERNIQSARRLLPAR